MVNAAPRFNRAALALGMHRFSHRLQLRFAANEQRLGGMHRLLAAFELSHALLELQHGTKLEELGAIDDKVKVLPPIKALKGTGKLDVLEVWGYIYKGEYRMRFIYVQGAKPGEPCALMGQEIIEASNPY